MKTSIENGSGHKETFSTYSQTHSEEYFRDIKNWEDLLEERRLLLLELQNPDLEEAEKAKYVDALVPIAGQIEDFKLHNPSVTQIH